MCQWMLFTLSDPRLVCFASRAKRRENGYLTLVQSIGIFPKSAPFPRSAAKRPTNVMLQLEPDSFFSFRAYLVYGRMDCSWVPRKLRPPCPPLCSPRSWPWRQIRSPLTRSTQLSGCDRREAQRGTLKVKQKHHEVVQSRSVVSLKASHSLQEIVLRKQALQDIVTFMSKCRVLRGKSNPFSFFAMGLQKGSSGNRHTWYLEAITVVSYQNESFSSKWELPTCSLPPS